MHNGLDVRAADSSHPLLGYLYLNTTQYNVQYVALADVSNDWDVITVMADGYTNSGSWTFSACFQPQCSDHETSDAFKAAVKDKISSGIKVELHFGGSGSNPLNFNSDTVINASKQVITSTVTEYGFSGIQFDLWASGCNASRQDDGITAQDATSLRIIRLIRDLRTALGDSIPISLLGYLITDTNGHLTTQSCVAVWHALRNDVSTFVMRPTAPFYSSGGRQLTDLDAAVAAMDLILGPAGAPVASSDTSFPSLPAQRVALIDAQGSLWLVPHADPTHVQAEMDCIRLRRNCQTYNASQVYPDFQGVVAISVNADANNGMDFSKGMHAYLASLTGGDSPSNSTTSAGPGLPTVSSPSNPSDANQSSGLSTDALIAIVVCSAIGLLFGLVICGLYVRHRRRARAASQGFRMESLDSRPVSYAAPSYATSTQTGHEITPYPLGLSGAHAPPETGKSNAKFPAAGDPLRAAVQRAGFSIEAVLDSLNRVSASRDGGSVSATPTRGDDGQPPTYDGDEPAGPSEAPSKSRNPH